MVNKKEAALNVSNVENCVAFMLDYFQTVKEENAAICEISNEAIDAIHKINRCLEDIKKTCGLRVSKVRFN